MTKLIIGLGNPGSKYKHTRHNVGYMFVDKFKKTRNIKAIAVRTDSSMNNSGDFVKRLVNKRTLNGIELYIVHDDLDIALGKFKIQKGKGPKDHKGLNSIYKALGTKDFYHVRIGVDNRDPEDKVEGEKYVLQNFSGEERKIIDKVLSGLVKELAK